MKFGSYAEALVRNTLAACIGPTLTCVKMDPLGRRIQSEILRKQSRRIERSNRTKTQEQTKTKTKLFRRKTKLSNEFQETSRRRACYLAHSLQRVKDWRISRHLEVKGETLLVQQFACCFYGCQFNCLNIDDSRPLLKKKSEKNTKDNHNIAHLIHEWKCSFACVNDLAGPLLLGLALALRFA